MHFRMVTQGKMLARLAIVTELHEIAELRVVRVCRGVAPNRGHVPAKYDRAGEQLLAGKGLPRVLHEEGQQVVFP